MFCDNCGKQIDDKAATCPHCGAATKNLAVAMASKKETNSVGIAGFVLSFFFPLIGLICSAVGVKRSKELSGSGKGLSIAGVIISLFWFIPLILIIVLAPIGIVGSAVGSAACGMFAVI